MAAVREEGRHRAAAHERDARVQAAHERAASVQRARQPRGIQAAGRRGALDARLGEVFAREADESGGARLRAVLHDALQAGQGRGRDLAGVAGGREIRIGIEARAIDGGHHPLQEPGDEIVLRGGAEADRIREALLERDAMVGDARREVQHVARTEHPLALGAEAAQDAKVEAGHVLVREALGHPPPAAAAALQQEDVVAVDVRPDGALGRGQADHHVVHSPARQEVEPVDQIGHGGHVRVHVLDEDCPVRGAEPADQAGRQRPRSHLPGPRPSTLAHEARLDAVARGQGEKARGSEGIAKPGHGTAHEQRPLLPMASQERLRAQPSEERRYFSRTGLKSRSW